MLKPHFRAKSNGYGDFLMRVPAKIWPNLHSKWSKCIQIYFSMTLFYIFMKNPRVAFQMLLKSTFNDLFWKNYQKDVIFYMSIQSTF